MVRPVTVTGLPVAVPLNCVTVTAQVAVYSVIGAEPVSAGGVNAIFAEALPGVASPIVGAPGSLGVTGVVGSPTGHAARQISKRAADARAFMGGRERREA